MYEKYAELILKKGVNIQKNQPIVLSCCLDLLLPDSAPYDANLIEKVTKLRTRAKAFYVSGVSAEALLESLMVTGVIDGDKILMTKYAGRDYKKYALVAGFAEIGETIEDTVRREVMEEVGLKVMNIRYYKSQPWSFTDTLLFGFFCEVDGKDKITMDTEELAFAEWLTREEIPTKYDGISLTNEMIMKFKNKEI